MTRRAAAGPACQARHLRPGRSGSTVAEKTSRTPPQTGLADQAHNHARRQTTRNAQTPPESRPEGHLSVGPSPRSRRWQGFCFGIIRGVNVRREDSHGAPR
eukprot:scaffold33381_cov90-Isochrysis_galbana.AAC.2